MAELSPSLVQIKKMDSSEVLSFLDSSSDGLSNEEAKKRLEKYGSNAFAKAKKISKLDLFLNQFKNTIQYILISAAILSFYLGETKDGIAILFAVLLSGTIGFVQESRSENALEFLEKLTIQTVRIKRKFSQQVLDSKFLVPGDLVIIEDGMKVPADIRLLESFSITVNESTMTGESLPVEKSASKDSDNILLCGTNIVSGSGLGVVVATGMNSEFGRIAALVSKEEKGETPLQKNLNEFGRKLGYLVIAMASIFFIVGIFVLNHNFIEVLTTSVILAVAGVSEGLPTVIAITLALGMQTMAKRNALVKRMTVIEDLGVITAICTDKTGTLTLNKMSPRFIYVFDHLIDLDETYTLSEDPNRAQIERSLECVVVANNATLGPNGSPIGDPTEGGLLEAAIELDFNLSHALSTNPRKHENPFDSSRKRMSVVTTSNTLFLKGALEFTLPNCTKILTNSGIKILDSKTKEKIISTSEEISSKGMRLIALAEKPADSDLKDETDLTFLGFVALYDPPRSEVRHAIDLCNQASISVYMITGDAKATAQNIAFEAGFSNVECTSGSSFEDATESLRKQILAKTNVFYRVSPIQKYLIVSTLKSMGHIVAVTGDGVNDAPAIKKGDIGISMGISGSDVTKEAAGMILLDDNFASIVKAIEYGRKIYENIINFIRFQLTTTITLLSTVFLSSILGFVDPLKPIQMLFINIIMDGPPALAIGLEPSAEHVMQKKPRNSQKPYLDSKILGVISFNSLFMTVAMLVLLFFLGQHGVDGLRYQTISFVTMVCFQLFNALNSRSFSESFYSRLLKNKILIYSVLASFVVLVLFVYIPSLSEFMKIEMISPFEFGLCIIYSSSILLVEEIRKRLRFFTF